MHYSFALIALASLISASPLPANTNVNPEAITSTTCTAKKVTINSHDINVALLSICGGIAGSIEQCQGNPTNTTGASGVAFLSLEAATPGQTIDITKGRWEGCMRAARAVCGDSPFTSTCIGGANINKGNVKFSLTAQ
ncbi:hypothetical protein ACQKWADRAFT_183325 [Trichoderma austrokoningii]